MADETSDNTGKLPRGARTSLVERAAEKLAAARSRDGTRQAAPAPEGLSTPPMPQIPLPAFEDARPGNGASAPQQEASPAAEMVDSPLPATPQDGSGSPGGAAESARKRRRRRSRTVTIDSAGLVSRGILTPATKRNRTVEEFRLIKRMVLSQRWSIQGAPGNTIVVTSALPAEGKTTTAINLAMSITAEEDLRVVLVDADFIKPDALRQLGVKAGKGLVDVLQNPGMDIGDVMLRTDIEKLSLIPSGQLHERCTELLASARMDSLIAELASRYEDRILIFDSPPILATTESVALTSHMGQVVFVVQAGRTKRESVNSALELIGERANLGLVLNRTTVGFGKTDFGTYYSSYYYGYGGSNEQGGQPAA